jgi:phosphotransferase system enzyme I (PtsI)
VIRTLDLGADKMGHKPLGEEEHNPFLGLRSIRLSLKNVTLFRTQLRAILRASALGQIELMFPLISTMVELRQAKSVLNDVMEDLAEEGIPFDADLKVGMMVEVPAAVMMIDRFLREVDFVSIGTNDLVQYTLAVDRDNKDVADLYQTVDPSVLRLIDATLKSAAEADVFVSVCGEISGQPAFAMLLLGMGVRALSVPPSLIPEIKKLCRSVSVPDCEAIYRCAMDMETAGEIKTYLHEELRKTVPELVPF